MLHENGVFDESPEGINHRVVTHNYSHQVAELSDKLEATQLRSDILKVKSQFTARLFLKPLHQEFYLSIFFNINKFDFNKIVVDR